MIRLLLICLFSVCFVPTLLLTGCIPQVGHERYNQECQYRLSPNSHVDVDLYYNGSKVGQAQADAVFLRLCAAMSKAVKP